MKLYSTSFIKKFLLNIVKSRCVGVNNVYYSTAQTETKCTSEFPHIPVMVREVLKYMNPQKDQTYIDMTFGAGGHSRAILDISEGSKIYALDRDPVGYENACRLAEKHPDRVVPLLGRFSELPELLKKNNIKQNSIDGILCDFGCSSMQFDTPGRGFSINADGPLDMRMDAGRFPEQLTAMDILARASEEDLCRILKIYGEEKRYKKIARAIIESRYLLRRLETTHELAQLIDAVCDDETRFDKLNRPTHTATKTFQALRICVNNELNEINFGMHVAQRYLKIGGCLVTLSFHSLEDTIVKRHIYGNLVNGVANTLPLKYINHSTVFDKDTAIDLLESCWQSLTKHVVTPSLEEIDNNPRSRSAKLRAAVRVK